jgi:hypothetical protein
MTLLQIKEEFQLLFKNLKIEFFRLHHMDGQGSPGSDLFNDNLKIRDIITSEVEIDFDIKPEMEVYELEETFFQLTGLNIQVFRYSAGLWLQTTATDHWTLEKQNEKGGRSLNETVSLQQINLSLQ